MKTTNERRYTIPFEAFLYSMLLIMMNVICFEQFGDRRLKEITVVGINWFSMLWVFENRIPQTLLLGIYREHYQTNQLIVYSFKKIIS
jgi:hypothetical protein